MAFGTISFDLMPGIMRLVGHADTVALQLQHPRLALDPGVALKVVKEAQDRLHRGNALQPVQAGDDVYVAGVEDEVNALKCLGYLWR